MVLSGRVVEKGSHTELSSKAGGMYQALAAAQQLTLENGEAPENECHDVLRSTASTRSAGLVRQPSRRSRASETEKPQQTASFISAKDKQEAEEAREKEITKTFKVPMRRLLDFTRAEWWCLLPGTIGAAASGAARPVMAGIFMLEGLFSLFPQPGPTPEEQNAHMWKKVNEGAIGFGVCAGAKLVATSVQYACFAKVGEALTMHIRQAILKAIIHTPGASAEAMQVYA